MLKDPKEMKQESGSLSGTYPTKDPKEEDYLKTSEKTKLWQPL